MKTQLTMLVLALAVATNGFAQTNKNAAQTESTQSDSVSTENMNALNRDFSSAIHFTLEPTLGYAANTFDGAKGTNGASLEPKSGFAGGLNILVGSERIQFLTGLISAQRGAILKNAGADSGLNYDLDYNLRYLEVPAMGRISFLKNQNVRFFAQGGLVLAFLQSAEAKVSNLSGGTLGIDSVDFKDSATKRDTRLAAGIGCALKLTRQISGIGSIDYQYGLTKINNTDGDDISLHNSALGVNLGVAIEI